MTNREFVARIVTGGRFTSKDSSISWRYILRIGRTKAKYLLAQKLDELTLQNDDSVITPVTCVDMKRVESKDCGIVEFKLCDTVMKSCQKLPEGVNGKDTSSIISVTTIDGMKKYHPTTPMRWARHQKRSGRYKREEDQMFFYELDGDLYTLGAPYEKVDILMITTDKEAAAKMSQCGPAADITDGGTRCTAWDQEFVCPDKLIDAVVKDTIAEVASFYSRVQPDENPNMDEHQKTKTTN